MNLKLIFLIAAIVVFILAALGVGIAPLQFGWIGMALFAASFLPVRA